MKTKYTCEQLGKIFFIVSNTVLPTGVNWLGPTEPYRFWIESQKVGNSDKIKPIPIGALNEWPKLQFYATMMSWVRVDLTWLFINRFKGFYLNAEINQILLKFFLFTFS